MVETSEGQEAGKAVIGAVVNQGLDAIQFRARRAPEPYPPHGGEWMGIKPGKWTPDAAGLPPHCPVQPLGLEGSNFYLVDANGQLFCAGEKAFGREAILKCFAGHSLYLYWAWPRHNKDGAVDNFKAEQVQEALFNACARQGLWSAENKVRGLGAWRGRDGGLVLHCGDALFVNGRRLDTGGLDGYLYPRRPAFPHPYRGEDLARANPSLDIFRALQRWNWTRPEIDPLLVFGWIVAAVLGGALEWRPSIFLVGDKGIGKSTLQGLVRDILGDLVIDTEDTTPAGIYQLLGQDSRPVSVDELEYEPGSRRVHDVIKLARIAASGGRMNRGGANHVGTQFRARSCFLFSAINLPPLAPQDLSRMNVIRLRRLDADAKKSAILPRNIDTMLPILMGLLMQRWDQFDGLFERYRDVLQRGGHSQRSRDTYGTFIAAAHLALGDSGMEDAGYPVMDEGLRWWADELAGEAATDSDDDNWRKCLVRLLTSRIEAWRGGKRQTVGALLEELYRDGSFEQQAIDDLAQAGLGLKRKEKGTTAFGWYLAVPNSGQMVAEIFRGSTWEGGPNGNGVWMEALRQGPPGVIVTPEKNGNRTRINGVRERCTLVDYAVFSAMAEDEG